MHKAVAAPGKKPVAPSKKATAPLSNKKIEAVGFKASVILQFGGDNLTTIAVTGYYKSTSNKLSVSQTSLSSLMHHRTLFCMDDDFDTCPQYGCYISASVTFSSTVAVHNIKLAQEASPQKYNLSRVVGLNSRGNRVWSKGISLHSNLPCDFSGLTCSVLVLQFIVENNDKLPELTTSVDDGEPSVQVQVAKSDTNFQNCPVEILKRILNFLGNDWKFKCILALAGTCKRFREMLKTPLLCDSFVDLQSFSIAGSPTEQACSFLAKHWAASLKHLRLSTLKSFPATGNIFEKIQLTTLLVRDCAFVNDAFVDNVRLSKSLQTLDISGCAGVTAKGLVKLNQLKSLRRLGISRLSCESANIFPKIVAGLNLLEVVDLAESKMPDADAICIELSKSAPNLKAVRLGDGKTLTDAGVEALISKCIQLEELSISWPVKRPELSFLNEARPNLRRLSMNSAFNEDLQIWAQFLPNLEQLNLSKFSDFDVSSVSLLLDSCEKMSLLTASSRCHIQPSSDEFLELRSRYPHCVIALNT